MSRTNNTIRNFYTGFFNKFLLLVFPFIIRTVMIKKLGSDYLGLSSLFSSILQVLNLTELGFSSAIVFSMYSPIAKKDTDTVCALLNLYKNVYRIIGVIILFIGLIIMPFLKYLVHGNYPSDINLHVLYLIYLMNTAVTYFMYAYKSSILIANQRNDYVNNINTFVYILQFIIQIVILCVFENYYAYIAITLFTNILNNILISIICKKKYPMYICSGKISKKQKEDIKKRVYGLMIQKVCATTRNSLDSIFISAFFGLTIVGIYNNYYMILASATAVISVIKESMIASVGNSIASESVEKNYFDMMKFNFIYMWLSSWCTVCLMCLYQPFMELWLGKSNMFSIEVVICFCIYFYMLKMGDIRSVYHEAVGLWYEGKYRALVESILNIILNYFLGKIFGIPGIILATVISLFFINFLYGSTIVFKYYFKNIKKKEFFKNHMFYVIITIIVCFITYLICSLLPNYGLLSLVIKVIICFIIPNLLFLIFYFKSKYFVEAYNFIKLKLIKNK